MTLTEFLLARIADDEAFVRTSTLHLGGDEPWKLFEADAPAVYSIGIDYRRVLAECAAKRRIIELHEVVVNRTIGEYACWTCDENDSRLYYGPEEGCETLRLLASVYANHPDFDEAWRL